MFFFSPLYYVINISECYYFTVDADRKSLHLFKLIRLCSNKNAEILYSYKRKKVWN